MYSIFDLFFDTFAYRPVYVISVSEMKDLQRTQNQDELEKFVIKRKDLKMHTKLSKKIVIYRKPSVALALCGALGALGRRFESCRPD